MASQLVIYNVSNLPAEMVAAALANKTAYTAELRAAFDVAINSDVFMSFEEKIDTLLDTLRIPISDDQSYNQFFIHSAKDLEGEVCRDAVKRQIIPVLPTLDQVHAEAKKRYDEKAAKFQRQSDKKAAKAAKSAPAEQQQTS
jgi:hypothetical protein